MTYTPKQIADWRAFEAIRTSDDRSYNMYGREARLATGLDPESYVFVRNNYDGLAAAAATLRVEPQPTPEWDAVLLDSASSYCLINAMRTFGGRDPVDALHDAELLVALLRAKLDRMVVDSYESAIAAQAAKGLRVGVKCPDCGEPGERKGHQTCQYPKD